MDTPTYPHPTTALPPADHAQPTPYAEALDALRDAMEQKDAEIARLQAALAQVYAELDNAARRPATRDYDRMLNYTEAHLKVRSMIRRLGLPGETKPPKPEATKGMNDMDAHNDAPTGPEMKDLLHAQGVAAMACTLRRSGAYAGCYVADFHAPGDEWTGARPQDTWSANATDSAGSWAARIQSALPGAKIVDTHENRADWRPGCPVIAAMVVFRWSPATAIRRAAPHKRTAKARKAAA